MATYPSIGGLIAYSAANDGTNTTKITIAGLWHFLIASLGTTVSVQLAGVDCGDVTVQADGTVTIPLSGTTIAGGAADGSDLVGVVPFSQLATISANSGTYGNLESVVPMELISNTATVYWWIPCVVGRQYVSQGQRLRSLSDNDGRTRNGPSLGETRRGHMYSMLVKDGVKVGVGTTFSPSPTGDLITVTFTDLQGNAAPPFGYGFDGVWWDNWASDYNFDNQFCWQIDRPVPLVICATTVFEDTEER